MSKNGPLKPLIDKLLSAYGYQDQLDEIELLKAYDTVVGAVFVKHTKEVYYKNKTKAQSNDGEKNSRTNRY